MQLFLPVQSVMLAMPNINHIRNQGMSFSIAKNIFLKVMFWTDRKTVVEFIVFGAIKI